ncbi:MAG TPA: CdaR family protein [Pseudogracilibacillus sp.]|nr:CdaR family protein [Pseudogracilibacillus sp.]
MDKLFQNKWSIRVMALIFAVSLYLFVNIGEGNTAKNDSPVIPSPGASDEKEVIDDVPLDVKIDDNYVVSGVPDEVSLTLKGKPRILRPVVQQENYNVFLDLQGLAEGEHNVDVEYSGIPDDLNVLIEPGTVNVNIEKRAKKEFPLQVELINEDQVPLGYEVGEPEVDIDTVGILSSEDIIEEIAMVKAFVNVADLTESIDNREVPITVYDAQGNDLNVKTDPENATVSVPIERPSKKVPLSVETTGELPDDFSLKEIEAENNEIEIYGDRDMLDSTENISTKEIDLSEVEGSKEYDAEIDFPENVTADEEKVPVNIEVEQEKTFDDINIDIKGKDAEDVTFEDPESGKITIIAKGSDSVISDLEESDIEASVDLGGMDSGKHKVEVDIEASEGIDFETEPKKVTLTIDE